MAPNSAPGVDGLTAGFYATFFDVLGETLLAMVNMVFKEKKKPASFGVGRIVLLHKDGAPPQEPASWRPITLLKHRFECVAAKPVWRLIARLFGIRAPPQHTKGTKEPLQDS
ncbi:hypothetical protein MTO96_046996 [Rhipicephalus appendiculatus]